MGEAAGLADVHDIRHQTGQKGADPNCIDPTKLVSEHGWLRNTVRFYSISLVGSTRVNMIVCPLSLSKNIFSFALITNCHIFVI